MKNEYYETEMLMQYDWMEDGKREARKDFKQYQDGVLTKEQLQSSCWMAQQYAAWGDYEGQCKGTGYLEEMEKLGFIKDLHVED